MVVCDSPLRRAALIHAALVRQVAEQRGHGRILGMADQAGAGPLLPDEAPVDQPLQMMREGRGRQPDLLLHLAHSHAAATGAHQ